MIRVVEDSHIEICKGKYKSDTEFWTHVASLLDVLTKQDYNVLFRYEDVGVYVLEFAYDPRKAEFGSDRFMKVSAEEEERLFSERNEPLDCSTEGAGGGER